MTEYSLGGTDVLRPTLEAARQKWNSLKDSIKNAFRPDKTNSRPLLPYEQTLVSGSDAAQKYEITRPGYGIRELAPVILDIVQKQGEVPSNFYFELNGQFIRVEPAQKKIILPVYGQKSAADEVSRLEVAEDLAKALRESMQLQPGAKGWQVEAVVNFTLSQSSDVRWSRAGSGNQYSQQKDKLTFE